MQHNREVIDIHAKHLSDSYNEMDLLEKRLLAASSKEELINLKPQNFVDNEKSHQNYIAEICVFLAYFSFLLCVASFLKSHFIVINFYNVILFSGSISFLFAFNSWVGKASLFVSKILDKRIF